METHLSSSLYFSEIYLEQNNFTMCLSFLFTINHILSFGDVSILSHGDIALDCTYPVWMCITIFCFLYNYPVLQEQVLLYSQRAFVCKNACLCLFRDLLIPFFHFDTVLISKNIKIQYSDAQCNRGNCANFCCQIM